MGEKGVARFSVLMGGLLMLGSACADAKSNAQARASAALPSEATVPEQVVQRMIPAGARVGGSNGAVASDAPGASPVGARTSADPITSKRLEHELDRLQAELGR